MTPGYHLLNRDNDSLAKAGHHAYGGEADSRPGQEGGLPDKDRTLEVAAQGHGVPDLQADPGLSRSVEQDSLQGRQDRLGRGGQSQAEAAVRKKRQTALIVEPLVVFLVRREEFDDVDVQITALDPYRVGQALTPPDLHPEQVIEHELLVLVRPQR